MKATDEGAAVAKSGRNIPSRYQTYFRVFRLSNGNGRILSGMFGWQCKRCGLIIAANTAGAQSHLMKHLRLAENGRKQRLARLERMV